jgi:hypothetical protein
MPRCSGFAGLLPVIGYAVCLLARAFRLALDQGGCHRRVDPRSPLGEQRPVRDFLRQRMPEPVLRRGMDGFRAQELRRAQRAQ